VSATGDAIIRDRLDMTSSFLVYAASCGLKRTSTA